MHAVKNAKTFANSLMYFLNKCNVHRCILNA